MVWPTGISLILSASMMIGIGHFLPSASSVSAGGCAVPGMRAGNRPPGPEPGAPAARALAAPALAAPALAAPALAAPALAAAALAALAARRWRVTRLPPRPDHGAAEASVAALTVSRTVAT